MAKEEFLSYLIPQNAKHSLTKTTKKADILAKLFIRILATFKMFSFRKKKAGKTDNCKHMISSAITKNDSSRKKGKPIPNSYQIRKFSS